MSLETIPTPSGNVLAKIEGYVFELNQDDVRRLAKDVGLTVGECSSPACVRLAEAILNGSVEFCQQINGKPVRCHLVCYDGTRTGEGPGWPDAMAAATVAIEDGEVD